MIGISTPDANAVGNLVIHELPESKLGTEMQARVTRRSTLDGGAVLVHSGFSHGDRTFTIKARLSEEDEAILVGLHQTETLLYFSIPEGFFSGMISYLDANQGDILMTVLIKEKLD